MKTVGIDKIKLLANDFTVNNAYSGDFAVDDGIRQGSSRDGVPYLFTDESGNRVHAYKIHHNSKHANYTVQRMGEMTYLNVNFNPSKIIHPYKLCQVGSDDYKTAIRIIESELSSVGVGVNIKAGNLSRIDISSQHSMGHPLSAYQSAFRMMGGSRLTKVEYQTGYEFGNKTHRCVFYDKIAEMKLRKMSESCKGESNLLRGEVRLQKSSFVSKWLNASKLSDMEAIGTHGLSDAYTRYLNRNVFAKVKGVHQSVINYEDELQYFKSLISEGRGEWKMYFIGGDIITTINRLGGYDGIRRFAYDAGLSRQQSYRAAEWVMDAYHRASERAAKKDVLTTSNLIDELYMKFAA